MDRKKIIRNSILGTASLATLTGNLNDGYTLSKTITVNA
jgi:hypothetical protein